MREDTITGWDALTELANKYRREKWIFRGVTRHDYDLVPKIGRKSARAKKYRYNKTDEELLLRAFKRQVRPMLEVQPESEFEWMAVAQHHGLNTRLLDWTESILIAAMFATESGISDDWDKKARKWVVVPPAIYGIQGLPETSSMRVPINIKKVMVYRPAHISARIAPQQAMFTVHPKPQKAFDHPALVRWKLEIKGTIGMKLALDAIGISRASLFPGIDGLAAALNWRHKWNSLKG